MDVQRLDANFDHERARLCHELAEVAKAAKPLFCRLYFLARAYEERAAAATLKLDRRQASGSSRSLIPAAALASTAR
jgi:hypothetical protein